jgi:flagellar biosynthetic protein FliQ
MTVEFVRELSGEVFKTILLAAGPLLIVGLLVGLIVSFLQSITQIQEFTLTFVPKILAVFFCAFLLLPWIAKVLITFTTNIIQQIPVYIR